MYSLQPAKGELDRKCPIILVMCAMSYYTSIYLNPIPPKYCGAYVVEMCGRILISVVKFWKIFCSGFNLEDGMDEAEKE